MPPMRTFHLIQVSDTHLGREQSWFAPNFRAMARIVSALRPDLVVNTGDISFDGAERDDDLAFARGCHAELDVPFRAIPGNHDVGDNPWRDDGPETITEQRLERYRRHFGEDYWLHEAGRWVLLLMLAVHQGRGDHEICGGPVAGHRDIADHRDPEQGLDVGVVRMWLQRVQISRPDANRPGLSFTG